MLEYEMITRGLFRADDVDISYDPTLTMPVTPVIQARMDALWQKKLTSTQQRNVPLYDRPLYRYVGAKLVPQDSRLILKLGNTSYKEHITSCEPEFSSQHPRAELSNAISLCSVVETSDRYILLDKRADADVEESRYHIISGFFERETTTNEPDPFVAMTREIHKKTGIQSADIRLQCCLGVAYDLLTPHAALCFHTFLKIPLAAVREYIPYESEIKQLHSLAVTIESLRAFILQNHGVLSATGEASLLMYGASMFGYAWFQEMMERIS